MKRPDTIMIEGRAFSWRVLCRQRREQLAAWEAAQPQQSALFEVKNDRRPEPERTAAGRYREPTLLALLQDAAEKPPLRSLRKESSALAPSDWSAPDRLMQRRR